MFSNDTTGTLDDNSLKSSQWYLADAATCDLERPVASTSQCLSERPPQGRSGQAHRSHQALLTGVPSRAFLGPILTYIPPGRRQAPGPTGLEGLYAAIASAPAFPHRQAHRPAAARLCTRPPRTKRRGPGRGGWRGSAWQLSGRCAGLQPCRGRQAAEQDRPRQPRFSLLFASNAPPTALSAHWVNDPRQDNKSTVSCSKEDSSSGTHAKAGRRRGLLNELECAESQSHGRTLDANFAHSAVMRCMLRRYQGSLLTRRPYGTECALSMQSRHRTHTHRLVSRYAENRSASRFLRWVCATIA